MVRDERTDLTPDFRGQWMLLTETHQPQTLRESHELSLLHRLYRVLWMPRAAGKASAVVGKKRCSSSSTNNDSN